MCGFVAQISKHGLPIDPSIIRKMNDKIVHRGPDDDGYFVNDWISLGFRRLSIIDVSNHGHQPMFDATKRFVCVFNGEIYNYIELRKELEGQGATFRTASDTEVLLQAYLHWGEACLDRLVGMYAFIVIDLEARSLFIARDFPGIKPLYFAEDQDFYYFASEIKAFKGVVSFDLNTDALYEQFNYRYLAGDRTLLKGVKKVLPGHYWKIANFPRMVITDKQFFNLKDTFTHVRPRLKFHTVVDEVESSLRSSFLLHTRSDVGFCAQLSGGVDSSFMTAILSEEQRNLHTYSITLDDAACDESRYQQEVVERYGLKHHSIHMTAQDYADNLELATYHMDAPIVHSGCVLLMNLCKHIAADSKVVLTGEGADELFGGYSQHQPLRSNEILFQLKKMGFTGRYIPPISKLKSVKRALGRNILLDSTRYQSDDVFSALFAVGSHNLVYRDEYSQLLDNNYTSAVLGYDQLTYLSSVLDRQDKISMAHSVEARVPFCNQQLYKQVNAYYNQNKFKNGERKAILKKCAEPYLSKELLYRKKNGLRLPLAEWYRDSKGVGRYLDLLVDKTARERGIYNVSAVQKVVDEFRKGDDGWYKVIFEMVNFEVWLREASL